MPHFYAIAIYRFNDYDRAGIPVLPVKKGMFITKIHMVLYTIAFIISALLLSIMGFTGNVYLTVTGLLGIAWLVLCLQGFKTKSDPRWARKVFLFSLIVITGICLAMAFDPINLFN
jgi:protoheme IX farnesyltransferase